MMLSCRYEIGARGCLFKLEDRGCGGGGYGADGFVYCGSEGWEVRIKVCKGLKGWFFFLSIILRGMVLSCLILERERGFNSVGAGFLVEIQKADDFDEDVQSIYSILFPFFPSPLLL